MRSDPRHVYVISFDTANTDLKYIVSHSDQVLDGVAAADIFYGDIINASTYSQRLNPIRANAEIGGIDFTFLDTDGGLSSLLNSKLLAGDGLRAKRVQHWVGEKGAEWSSGYDLIQTQQIHDSIKITNDGLGYQFTGRDIQRSELENIFEPKVTTLAASLSKSGITVDVGSTTGIDLIQHGPSYSDAPNDKVLYVRVKDEYIRCTAKTSTTLTVDNAQTTLSSSLAKDATVILVNDSTNFDTSGVGYISDGGTPEVLTEIKWRGKLAMPSSLTGVSGVTVAHSSGDTIVGANGRGALGTVPAAYEYDSGATSRTKVEEHIYYELPAMKLKYAIQTGTLYGSADTIPAHHQLGISTDWISTSEYVQYPDDIWDTTDDTAGVVLRFSGLKKTNAKKFIEEELDFWCGVFSPVLNTGELGLRKMTGVISDAAHSGILNEDNIISIQGAKFDLNDVHNNITADWNHDAILKDYTRHTVLSDSDSQSKWGSSKTLELKSKGLHGSRHTDNILASLFNMWRDRHAGPPFKATLELDYSQRNIKVGDIKRLQLNHIPEFTDQDGNYSSFDASVEIQSVRLNPQSGTVTVSVFGSTQKATPLVFGSDSSPAADAWFIGEGSDISGATTGTLSGGGTIWTIDGNSSITGADDLSSATATSDNDTGIFYWDGDLVIDSGVTLTISKNIELRVNGTFTNNGTIDGAGNGLAGGTTGLSGAIGNTKSVGGVEITLVTIAAKVISSESDIVEGIYSKAPNFILSNEGGTALNGRPTNLQGSSGGKGGSVIDNATGTTTAGANGGNSGAGLAIYCKGAVGGISSVIDLSGDDGSEGTLVTTSDNFKVYAGSGAGGAAGILALYLIGNTVTETASDYFTAINGDTPIFGTPLSDPQTLFNRAITPPPFTSYYTGIGSRDVSRANLLVDWVPDNLTVEADAAPLADTPVKIEFTENVNTPQTPAENLATVDVTITAPSDTSYSHSFIRYKLASADDSQFVPLPNPIAKDETVAVLPMDGSEYTFRAYPVNIDGVESTDFIQQNFTMSDAVGYVGDPATGTQLQYDSSTDELTVGEQTYLKGTNSYTDETTFINIPVWFSIDGLDSATVAGGTVTLDVLTSSIKATVPAASTSDNAYMTLQGDNILAGVSFTKNRKFKTKITFSAGAEADLYAISGGNATDGFGFKYNAASATWQAWNRRASVTTTNITISSGDTVEAVFDAGTNIKFYVNGSLVATHTTNLPTGAGQSLFAIHADCVATGALSRQITAGETKILVGF
jgi:hypothetical protein